MARPRSKPATKRAESYRHEEEALLRPDVGTQAQFKKKKPPKTYRYDSSLSPALDHDAPVYCRAADVAPTADRALEREANLFAAELLMPEPAVRAEFARAASAGELAGRFGVSEEAMSWRLYNVGLAEERPQ